jgi:predicted Zn-dependent peptidase
LSQSKPLIRLKFALKFGFVPIPNRPLHQQHHSSPQWFKVISQPNLLNLKRSYLSLKTWLLVMLLSWGIWVTSIDLSHASSLPLSQSRSIQPYLDRVEQAVTKFQLSNGLKFIVLERHQAPVVSFMTYADVGAVDEPDGQTGVAHFLEHLAFKGTQHIGTTDYKQEKQTLAQLDQAFADLQAARKANDPASIQALEAKFEGLKKEAARFVEQNKFGQIVEQAGGVGLNASTAADTTRYFYSLPSNKLELWMSLESERFLEPVFRSFYEEKDVILEERRLRLDNDPINQLFDAVKTAAFAVHPYGRPIIGYEADIQALSRQNVEDFFAKYYGPANLTVAIVGDVDPKQVKTLAETYFGRYQAQNLPKAQLPVEPPQTQPKEVNLALQTQPWYLEAYHSPSIQDPDAVVVELLSDILASGRTSRLYQALVDDQQVALAVRGYTGYPDDKYPNLMLLYALPSPGHSLEEVAAALEQQLTEIKTNSVSATELERIQTQARAGLLRSLRSNPGMASLLTEYEVKTGDWENLFRELQAISQVTPADIQRVAQAILRPENRTIGRLTTASSS